MVRGPDHDKVQAWEYRGESEAKEYCLVLDVQLYDWPETLILDPVAGWLYSLLLPFLTVLIQGVIKADIPSLVSAGITILGNILTVIGGWELLKKLLPKKTTVARSRKDRM